MPVLLHIDSSPLLETSVSRELTRHFVTKWKAANAGGTVIARDLSLLGIPPASAAWIGANFTAPHARTSEQKAELQLSDMLVSELQTADDYVFGVAMHNFGIPCRPDAR